MNTLKTAGAKRLFASFDQQQCQECVLSSFLCDLFDSEAFCPPKLGTAPLVSSKALHDRLVIWTRFNQLETVMSPAAVGLLLREKFNVFSQKKHAGMHYTLRALRTAGTVKAPQALTTHAETGCPMVRLGKEPGRRFSFSAPPDIAKVLGSMSLRARNEFLIAASRHKLQKAVLRQDPSLNIADFASFLDGQAKGGDEIAGLLLEQFSAFLRSRTGIQDPAEKDIANGRPHCHSARSSYRFHS